MTARYICRETSQASKFISTLFRNTDLHSSYEGYENESKGWPNIPAFFGMPPDTGTTMNDSIVHVTGVFQAGADLLCFVKFRCVLLLLLVSKSYKYLLFSTQELLFVSSSNNIQSQIYCNKTIDNHSKNINIIIVLFFSSVYVNFSKIIMQKLPRFSRLWHQNKFDCNAFCTTETT